MSAARAPFSEANTTSALYNAAVSGGRRITYEAPSGTNDFWESSTTLALYNAATSGGRRIIYGVPTNSNDYWESVSQSLFNTNNSTSDESDGWRDKSYTAPFDVWQSVTKAVYDVSNITVDESDGWRVNQVYSAPYDSFTTTSATTLIMAPSIGI